MNIKQIKKIIDMPVEDKLKAVNEHLSFINSNQAMPSLKEIKGSICHETLLNQIYMKINKPHSIC